MRFKLILKETDYGTDQKTSSFRSHALACKL